MHFIDEVKIYLKAGSGGDGAVSFRREKFIEFGGPDGGHGGKGADIVLRAIPDLNTLIDFRYQQHFRAQNGVRGMGRLRSGKSGTDMVIEVPLGTEVYDASQEVLLADLSFPQQEIIIAHGGRGGAGNAAFKSSTNQAPNRAKLGIAGEELWVWLKLKLLSDIGLVGLPNAGKSTLLAAITDAKPKIADYPFTTLTPQLGISRHLGMEMVIADMPGLIEGASRGLGLGDRFLKHVERCRVLMHILDVSADCVTAYQQIREELASHSASLATKPEIIVLNKIDLVTPERLLEVAGQLPSSPIMISAACRTGLQEFLDAAFAIASAPRLYPV